MEKTYFLVEEIIMDKGWKAFLDIVKNGEFGEWLEQNGFSYENELLNEYFQQEDFSDIELIMKICKYFTICLWAERSLKRRKILNGGQRIC